MRFKIIGAALAASLVTLGIFDVKWKSIQKSTSPQRFLISKDDNTFSQDSIDRSDPGIYPGFYMQWLNDEWGASIYSDALLNAAFESQTERMDTLNSVRLDGLSDSTNMLFDSVAALRTAIADIPPYVQRTGMPIVMTTIMSTTTSISGTVVGQLPFNTVGTLASDAVSSDTSVGQFWLLTGQAFGTAWGGLSFSANPYKGYTFDSLYLSSVLWMDNSAGGDVAPDAWFGLMGSSTQTRVLSDPTTTLDAIGFRRLGSTGQWHAYLRSNGSTIVDQTITGPALGTYFKPTVVVTPSAVYWYLDNTLVFSTTSQGKRGGAFYYFLAGMNRNPPSSGNYRMRILAGSAVVYNWRRANNIIL